MQLIKPNVLMIDSHAGQVNAVITDPRRPIE